MVEAAGATVAQRGRGRETPSDREGGSPNPTAGTRLSATSATEKQCQQAFCGGRRLSGCALIFISSLCLVKLLAGAPLYGL